MLAETSLKPWKSLLQPPRLAVLAGIVGEAFDDAPGRTAGARRMTSAERHPIYSLRLWPSSHSSFIGGARVGTSSTTRSAAMSGERRLDRQANDESSLAMSFVVLFVVLAAMVAIVANADVQLSTAADLFDGLP